MLMKHITRLFALLITLFATANSLRPVSANGADFQYGFLNVFSPNALDYVVEQVNVIPYDEGTVKYWCPGVAGTPASITMRFSFPRVTTDVFLFAPMSLYSGSGSVWSSKDGADWTLLSSGGFNGNLPSSLMDSTEI